MRKYEKEINLANNPQKRAVPQVLPKDGEEMLFLAKTLCNAGYTEINLNLGCPYPMVTKRGKGAGLLPNPKEIEKILDAFFNKTRLKLSVKMRAGLISEDEIERVIPVLNQFPLSEIIVHPRIAKQLYAGQIAGSAFEFASNNTKHKLVYNGDIFSVEDFETLKSKFPQIDTWMLGRGILMNPFLPSEIKGQSFSNSEKHQKLVEFHGKIFESYSQTMDNQGNVLNKMKQFWIYFSYNFKDPRKVLKSIKKASSMSKYREAVAGIFRN